MTEFHDLLEGDQVEIINNTFGLERSIIIEIRYTRIYDSISAMVEYETVAKCCPGLDTIDQAIDYYNKMYEEELKYYYTKVIEIVILK